MRLMRESKRTEKMHLPKDSTELWLEAQEPAARAAKHRNPAMDSYEAWIAGKVGERLEQEKAKRPAVKAVA